jgi:hypothetical protein
MYEEESHPGNKNFLLSMCLLYSSLLPPVPQTKPKSVVGWGNGVWQAIERLSGPPELTQIPLCITYQVVFRRPFAVPINFE